MAFSKTCWECGGAFNDPSNFRRHIKPVAKPKQKEVILNALTSQVRGQEEMF